jgi:hypothetical protein
MQSAFLLGSYKIPIHHYGGGAGTSPDATVDDEKNQTKLKQI